MNDTTTGGDRARARALGIRLAVTDAEDRVTPDGSDTRGDLACPTCEDGILTIASPIHCRECTRERATIRRGNTL